MNYFGQVFLEILENNKLKSYFGNSRNFVLISWNFLTVKIKLAKSCFFVFFKKTLKYTYQQRDATNGYCEVLNMNLNIWFDIPSKDIENSVSFFLLLWVYFQKD